VKRTKLYILIFLLLSSILSAQKVDIYKRPLNFERSHDYDAVHYKLEFKFDLGNYLLKEWSFEKSLKELLFQLKNDDIIGRMWAASELLKFPDESKAIPALIDRAENDSFWKVRKDAVELLGKKKRPEHVKFFKVKCEDKNSRVRTAALKVLGGYNDSSLVSFFKDHFLKDDSYRAQAEAINAIGKCGGNADIPFLKKAAQMESPRRIIKRATERALKNIS
jgi:aminopeptidase N